MPPNNRPEAEIVVNAALVRALLESEHPDLARLPVTLLAEGWDNFMFKLGDDLTVRLPRRQLTAEMIEHEQRWLPELASRLPLPIPAPVRVGGPAAGYPWSWSICPWLPGEIAEVQRPDDRVAAADALGQFLVALHTPAPDGAPKPVYRGMPLAERDERLHEHLAVLGDAVDADAVRARWQEALAIGAWRGPPTWLHGDLHGGNVLVDHGEISGVIDFVDLCGGDPAVDLLLGWMLFDGPSRDRLRKASGADDDMWARGHAWAMVFSVALLANSADTPLYAAMGRRTLDAVLADRL